MKTKNGNIILNPITHLKFIVYLLWQSKVWLDRQWVSFLCNESNKKLKVKKGKI
jgi:hypothetical protein